MLFSYEFISLYFIPSMQWAFYRLLPKITEPSLTETKMGCNTSKSTAVVESVQKPGEQPEEEEKDDPCTETTADAAQNLALKDSACDRTSWNRILMYFKYKLQLWSKQLNYWCSVLEGIDLCITDRLCRSSRVSYRIWRKSVFTADGAICHWIWWIPCVNTQKFVCCRRSKLSTLLPGNLHWSLK